MSFNAVYRGSAALGCGCPPVSRKVGVTSWP